MVAALRRTESRVPDWARKVHQVERGCRGLPPRPTGGRALRMADWVHATRVHGAARPDSSGLGRERTRV